METTNSYTNDKLEFRQIVLGHIKRILELSSHELRNTTYIINHGNFSDTKYQEDTRVSYIQAIENLAYVLMPYFDNEILEVYDKCEKIINGWGYEVRKTLSKTFERIKEETGKEDLGNIFVIEMRLRYAKKLFVALNMLLKRNDYLKSAVYGEDKDELGVEDTNEGDEE